MTRGSECDYDAEAGHCGIKATNCHWDYVEGCGCDCTTCRTTKQSSALHHAIMRDSGVKLVDAIEALEAHKQRTGLFDSSEEWVAEFVRKHQHLLDTIEEYKTLNPEGFPEPTHEPRFSCCCDPCRKVNGL